MTKKEKIKFAYLTVYGALLVVGMIFLGIFAKTDGGKILLICLLVHALAGLIGFIIMHNRITYYTCSHCKKEFRASLIETMFATDRGVEGKNIKCPHCGEKDFHKVVR